MHPLFVQVLSQRNLSKAGELFSVEDRQIVENCSSVLNIIQDIITQTDFLTSHNDQSLVEICMTRLTSAIRETESIEAHAKAMVHLLEACLSYNLRPNAKGNDPAHAKIASDIMSCIFLNYSKKNVMELTLPVAVKFLHKGNKELSRNMSSYLSLAAIENAELLAQHIQPIIDSVISGNYSLAKVLPTIYAVNRNPINNHVMTLVSILPNCDNTEKLALLSLFGLVAKDNPDLLESSVPQLCESLMAQGTAAATFQVLYNVALTKPQILADHVEQYKSTAENFPKTAMASIQVMCAIAKVKQEKASETMDFILLMIGRLESEKHSMVLKEIMSLTARYPHLLTPTVINKVSTLEDGASSATRSYIKELRNEYNSRSRELLDHATTILNRGSSGVTIVKVDGSRTELSSLPLSQHLYLPKSESTAVSSRTSQTPTSLSTTLSGAASASASSAAVGSAKTVLERSHGRLPGTHRSMTKLNSGGSAFDSRMGLHKSMTRLSASSQQNMMSTKFSSSGRFSALQGSGLSTMTSSQPWGQQALVMPQQRVSISTLHGVNLTTKSMSSGSMSGVAPEVLTVNVSQINADLLDQVSKVTNVISQHNGLQSSASALNAASYQSGYAPSAAYPPTSSVTSTYISQSGFQGNPAPYSLPYPTNRRPVSSSVSQPPSLGIPSLVPSGSSNAALSSASTVQVPGSYASSSMATTFTTGTTSSSSQGALPSLSHHTAAVAASLPPPYAAAVTPRFVRSNPPQNVYGPALGHQRGGTNTLPSPRRKAALNMRESELALYNRDSDGKAGGSLDGASGLPASSSSDGVDGIATSRQHNRMSVFEPYPMRDTVQHFCEKHLEKIKAYMTILMAKLPLPVKCTIEERKGRKHAKLHFACQGRSGEHCLYKTTFYTMKTRHPRTWIHLMFLALQARSTSAISTRESSVSALKHCWEILNVDNITFVTLVTGAFPPVKDQDNLMHELRFHRFFDVFEFNGEKQHWGCFLCNHPERAEFFAQENEPVIEGQLKEKKGGKWKLFKKWKSRYFTLSGAKLTYKENGETGMTQTLDVGSIRSVKVSKEGKRNIPKAFEIFTNDRTFILKAKNGSNAQEWVQCLSVAKAHSQARETNLKKLAYGGSLGRLPHHGRAALNAHALANSSMALRTAV